MSNILKTGSRWKSVVCDTEVVIVRPPTAPATLECGGAPMVPIATPRPEGVVPAADRANGSLLGKRYGDETLGLEVLCTKAGKGSLAVSGRALVVREAKKLPSSD
jgi:hypothetical protein